MLAHLGCAVATAATGQEALDRLAAQRTDVVFIDLRMSGMDGFELTRRILESIPVPIRPRLIALTGSCAEGERDRCLAVGFDDYLEKPFGLAVLASVIKPLLNSDPPSQTTAELTVPSPPDSNQNPAFDRRNLDSLGSAAGVDSVTEWIDMFLRDASNLLAEIWLDLEGNRPAHAADRLHCLKGSASTIGGIGLAAMAREAETRVLSGTVSSWSGIRPGLESELDALQSYLKKEFEHRK